MKRNNNKKFINIQKFKGRYKKKKVFSSTKAISSMLVTNLEDLNVRRPIRTVATAVPFDVLEPLNVRLSVAVDLAVELNVTANNGCGVGR